VGVVALLFGSLLAARMARRILGSVQAVSTSARSISETDLSRRIDVQGDDEIARLAETFNELLARLERAFLAQRAFVDDAGHELRTPITIVRGHLEGLGDDPEERRHTIELVTDELDRMARMVNDLLLMAKAQQPALLRMDLVDVGELTRDVAAKAAALAPRDWRVEAQGDGAIIGDRQRLTQAMVQLAQNAADHTHEGDMIGIGSAVGGGVARMWVRDTGPGIPPETQERIFERFHRGGTRHSEGAGLGLPIVKAIAEGHGGSVSAQSVEGEGATFTIEVPVNHPTGEAGA
jgi:signal transduction histidine kinase